MKAVECINLTKKYGEVTALDGCSLSVEEGRLFGLLGVNGAGKTTLIKILCGLTCATDGEAFVFGKSVKSELAAVKKVIAVSPQETSVAGRLTVRENLEFFASVYLSGRDECRRAVEETIETFSLGEVLNRRAGKLSGGWQRRLSIAAALISSPKLLFLDEPTLGLDVLARRELWRVIERVRLKTTVVLTSHYLEEIDALCDGVAVLDRGRLIAEGTVEEIKSGCGAETFEDAFVKIVEGKL